MTFTSRNSFRDSTKNMFSIVFERDGNVFFSVLPYCFVNVALLVAVSLLEERGIHLSFSPTGHGLMTLLVSFLVISKVNLSYERFRVARHSVGSAFLRLRELNQMMVILLEANKNYNENSSSNNTLIEKHKEAWKAAGVEKILVLLEATKQVLQSSQLARYLACNDGHLAGKETSTAGLIEDPMELVQDLRFHLYLAAADQDLELLERVQLLGKLGEYVTDYRQLLDLASTPLPFSLIQMGRAFLFIWTFSMPLVLRQGPFSDLWSAGIFLFFLTYGFIGLELVAMQLATPFGDSANDVRVTALCEATASGIQRDLHVKADITSESVYQRRRRFAGQKTSNLGASETIHDPDNEECALYHSMHFGP